MSEAVLYYFDGRGKAEIIRFMFAAAGIKFREIILTKREEFTKLLDDGLLDFNQLPLVSVDGFTSVQTGAIVRYLARKGGLYGKTDEEAALIDKFYEGSRDFQGAYMPLSFQDDEKTLKGARDVVLPRYLPAFEKALKNNGTGYLVGNSLTMADVGLYEALSNTIDFIGPDSLKDYSNLQQFYKTVGNLPRISEFVNGPQKKRANDKRYVEDVKRVLDW